MNTNIAAQNVAELYRRAAERYGDLPAFATRRSHSLDWQPVSFRELYNIGLDLAAGLIDLEVHAREHVGLFGDNRVEWILSDYGIQLCGAVNVPRGRDVTDDELLNRIRKLWPKLNTLRELILLDAAGRGEEEQCLTLDEVLGRGRALRQEGDTRAEDRISRIMPEDLFTLIYTSGTTGEPKGVMLTHANMMSQMRVIPIELNCTDRVLSILPIWHIFERVFEMYTISCGTCTYYTNIRNIGEDLRNVEPTFMGSAPRLWEGLYKRIMEGIRKAHPVRRGLFHIAYFLGRHYKDSVNYIRGNNLKIKHEPVWMRTILLAVNFLRWFIVVPWFGFFNATVLESIRLSTGGSLKATVSGGGALPLDIDRFFNYIGLPVLEGYGLTETSPVVAARTEDRLVVGTIGPPVSNTEVRIVDVHTNRVLFPNPEQPHEGRGLSGEIQIRGPQVMKGYYRLPERTALTIVDGWLRTGDVGMMTFNDCLKILGRSKSTIVLSNGENLEPEPIEIKLSQSHYIDHCMIVGQDQKYIGALIVPSLEGFRENGIPADSLDELARKPEVHQIIDREIRQKISTNNGFRNFECIRDFRILDSKFEVGEELTELFKMKRHIITDKYRETIQDLFSPEDTNGR